MTTKNLSTVYKNDRIKELETRVAKLESALRECRNLSRNQEQSPSTVGAVGVRIGEIVDRVVGKQ